MKWTSVKMVLFLLIIPIVLSACSIQEWLQIKQPKHKQESVLPKEGVMEEEDLENHVKDNPSVRLMFIGDNMMTDKVAAVMDEKGNDYPLREFLPLLEEADLVLANLETAVGTSGILEEKQYAFQTTPSRFELFEPLREKMVFSLANNHGMDAPLAETMEVLDRLGYAYIGVGRNQQEAFHPFVQEINGVTLAVIGTSRVIPYARWSAAEEKPGMASAYADEPLLRTVQEWSQKVDYVIVYTHWGKELADEPDDVQLVLEEKLMLAGADIIIGSHPHVLQGLQWYDEKQFTAYSLGNFVFTTSLNKIANDTIVLELQVSADKIEEIHVWPGQVQFGLVRYLEEEEGRQRVFERLKRLSPTITIDESGRITNLR